MSYKFDSLITILRKLDSRERITVSSIMAELEISERSAYRHIQTLQVAGFPITFDRKKRVIYSAKDLNSGSPTLQLKRHLPSALQKASRQFRHWNGKSLNSIEEKLSVKEPALPQHIVLKAEKLSPIVGRDILEQSIRRLKTSRE